MNSCRVKERWYDPAKGVGILLVLFGHWFNAYSGMHKVIYGFHMPLFFVLAGLQIERSFGVSPKETVRKLLLKLGVPFVTFWLLGAILSIGCGAGPKCLKQGLLAGHPVVNGPIWFLVVLAFAKLLVIVVQKSGLNALLSCLTFGVLFIIWNCCFPSTMIGLPATMGSWIPAAFFLCLGWLLSDWIRKNHSLLVWILSVAALALSGIIAVRFPISYMAIGSYPNGCVFLLTGVMGSIGMLLACRQIQLGGGICFIGANSLCYFGMDLALYPLWIAAGIDGSIGGFVIHLAALSALAVPTRIILRKSERLMDGALVAGCKYFIPNKG